MSEVPANRVRVQRGTDVTVGEVVGFYKGGHTHGPEGKLAGGVEVHELRTGTALGIFCRWCRQRVDGGAPATLLPDTMTADMPGVRTYAT